MTYRRFGLVAVALIVVAAATTSVVVRAGEPLTAGNLVVLLALAGLSAGLVVASSRWRILVWEALICVLGWVLLIGPAGDTSCTDCAFVLLLPINAVLAQAALLLAALVFPSLRRP